MATLIGLDIATLLAITAVPLVAKPAVAVLKLSAKYQLWMTYGAGFILVVWVVAALWLLGRRATPVQPRRFGLAVVAASMLPAIFLPLAPLVPGASQSFNGLLQLAFDAIGEPEPAANAPSTPPIDVEAAFNRQPQLIDAALDRMAPSRSGRHELYFVGMAPYASQDVFKREINSVLGIVDERLGTAGRSLVMINHRDTLQSIPLATVSNLERVLWRLAQIMDTNKDILMLFITTHGSEGLMSVTFPEFALNQITPDRLAAMLERTGIKNRVLILSACHSGSFLPALTHPDSLVMAAARADRASFGCENERDWTYFGDALFNHAFRETRSFTAAFERARALVGDWEVNQQPHAQRSEPQIAIGARIAVKLNEVALELERTAALTPAPLPEPGARSNP